MSLVSGLVRWEGILPHMYLDTRGVVTVGIGNYLPTLDAALALPFHVGGIPATADQIRQAYQVVALMAPGMPAERYRLHPSVELLQLDALELATKRLVSEFIPGLQRVFPNFDRYPEPAKAALVDMAYNLGVSGLAKFRHLIAACEAGRWDLAADECHRSSSRNERNDWTREQFAALAGTPAPDVA